jgi:hypothetical protein
VVLGVGGIWGDVGWGTYVSYEGCGAGGAGEEVEPFFGLDGDIVSKVLQI